MQCDKHGIREKQNACSSVKSNLGLLSCSTALVMQVVFQYQGLKKVRLGPHHWDSGDREDWDNAQTDIQDDEHWDSSVYSRVFLVARSAELWEAWNRCVACHCNCCCICSKSAWCAISSQNFRTLALSRTPVGQAINTQMGGTLLPRNGRELSSSSPDTLIYAPCRCSCPVKA